MHVEEYKLCSSDSSKTLETQVNELIKLGFQPYGMAMLSVSNGGSYNNMKIIIQPMVRYKPNEQGNAI